MTGFFDCDACVEAAVREWSGVPNFPLDISLREIWAVHNGDTCGTEAMRRLALRIHERCETFVDLGSSWCDRTVRTLIQQVCGT